MPTMSSSRDANSRRQTPGSYEQRMGFKYNKFDIQDAVALVTPLSTYSSNGEAERDFERQLKEKKFKWPWIDKEKPSRVRAMIRWHLRLYFVSQGAVTISSGPTHQRSTTEPCSSEAVNPNPAVSTSKVTSKSGEVVSSTEMAAISHAAINKHGATSFDSSEATSSTLLGFNHAATELSSSAAARPNTLVASATEVLTIHNTDTEPEARLSEHKSPPPIDPLTSAAQLIGK
ncbi:hypothetical protein LTR39_001412, partial [Cryomyces antarcticus]